ncbi:WYL domain-containing protein [Streptomyces sp. NPDC016626]|uniref:WYL domain-containing protein n=1 Tax=Streptomyces sp. NPDC016626 TaxID=3364968 RepID=UPI0036FE23A0
MAAGGGPGLGTARLRLSPRGRKLPPTRFGAAGAGALADAGPPDGEGRVEVGLAVGSEPVATGGLLRLGVEAEVLGPAALRQAVATAATVLAGRYARGRRALRARVLDPARAGVAPYAGGRRAVRGRASRHARRRRGPRRKPGGNPRERKFP